jgi:hypothetical protein
VTVAAPAAGHDRQVAVTNRWQLERALVAVRATLVMAGSIVGATLTAIVEGAGGITPWQAVAVAAALAGSLGAAVVQYVRLGRLYGNYLKSLGFFAVVQRLPETAQWIRSRSS